MVIIQEFGVAVTSAKEMKKKIAVEAEKEGEVEQVEDEVEVMDDGRRVFNKKTMKDQHGNYPVWLSSRKLKKAVKRNKTTKRNQKKKGKKS